MKVLIVEDESHLAQGLRFNLAAESYEVSVCESGEEALEAVAAEKFDVVVLDVMLPGINGFAVTRTIRNNGDYTPILMLTALGRPEDVIRGFEAGADDYLPKPFDLNVFIARIKGLVRRSGWERTTAGADLPDVVVINGREIDFDNLELRSDGETIHLTLMEGKLLRYLIENEGRAVSRKSILEEVWELRDDTDTRAIDNFIVRLRRYIEDEPNNPRILQTVRGVGYRFLR